jgi:hypothetical protein
MMGVPKHVGGSVTGKLVAAFAMVCTAGAVLAAQQPPVARVTPAPPAPNMAMAGFWDYNAPLSVDAATGRPEQAPQSATQRPRRGAAASGAGGPAAGPAIGGVGGSMDDFERNAMAVYVAERRALIRDLLEVPETLRIAITDAGVTFTDDLKRERTYLSNNKPQKYQIGAARFDARGYWDAGQFHKDIEGPNGFKMSELYLLSEDGARLHVVIRLGDPRRPETVAGVNRVYDRVPRSFSRSR